MQDEDWLENKKGTVWFKRYLMMNAMNTSLMLIIYFFFLFILIDSLGSPGDLPDYVVIIIMTLVTVIILAAVLSVWIRIITLRKHMPLKVAIDHNCIAWKTSTEETKVPWNTLKRSDPIKYEKGKLVHGIVTGLIKSARTGRDEKPTGSAFYRWVFKRLMIDEAVVDAIRDGYDKHLLSKS
jgi:hypothetical protein